MCACTDVVCVRRRRLADGGVVEQAQDAAGWAFAAVVSAGEPVRAQIETYSKELQNAVAESMTGVSEGADGVWMRCERA